jgi:hypothetical protein
MKRIIARLALFAVVGGLVPLGMVAVSAKPASAAVCAYRVPRFVARAAAFVAMLGVPVWEAGDIVHPAAGPLPAPGVTR